MPDETPLSLAEVQNEIRRGHKMFLAFRQAEEMVRVVAEADGRKAQLEQEIAQLERRATEATQATEEAEREHAQAITLLTEERQSVEAGLAETRGGYQRGTTEAEHQHRARLAELENEYFTRRNVLEQEIQGQLANFDADRQTYLDRIRDLTEQEAHLRARVEALRAEGRQLAERFSA
jgi:hypothetical protein